MELPRYTKDSLKKQERKAMHVLLLPFIFLSQSVTPRVSVVVMLFTTSVEVSYQKTEHIGVKRRRLKKSKAFIPHQNTWANKNCKLTRINTGELLAKKYL